MNIDLLIASLILTFVGIYIVFRYVEEKKKYKKNYIPMLESFIEKCKKEKKYYQHRADNFKQKIEEIKKQIQKIKSSIKDYKWTDEDIKDLRNLKGTEFETIMTGILRILDYKVEEPPIFKDNFIDFIAKKDSKKICIYFLDSKKIKNFSEKTVNELLKGKEKYKCDEVWIISNIDINRDLLNHKDIKLFTEKEIIKEFPSLTIFIDYEDAKTRLHNYELLYKETYDEVIRRNEWIEEANKKIQEFQSNMSNLSN